MFNTLKCVSFSFYQNVIINHYVSQWFASVLGGRDANITDADNGFNGCAWTHKTVIDTLITTSNNNNNNNNNNNYYYVNY